VNAVTTEHTSRFFEGRYIDEGYGFIGVGEENGWRAISAWGRDGWDLGDWPYVVYLFRDRVVEPSTLDNDPATMAYERACYVEGDITIESFATAEDRERETDESALFYWRHQGASWLNRPEADLRGPYSRKRAE
jgi:hypothetical protein